VEADQGGAYRAALYAGFQATDLRIHRQPGKAAWFLDVGVLSGAFAAGFAARVNMTVTDSR
jgi:hypothetical protein